jgi:4'-phosphopantetheinyl transferase EntD
VKPYTIVYREAVHHGVIIGVSLPEQKQDVPADILSQLHPEEQTFSAGLRGFRKMHWVGSRLATSTAFHLLGYGSPPVLSDPWGAPTSQCDLSISISHKRHMAVAIVARSEHGSLGVDLEDLQPERKGIAERILRPDELLEVSRLPADRQWISTLLRFSVKESIYKALAPRQRRYIDFSEAQVSPKVDGSVAVTLHLVQGPYPAELEARYTWINRSVLTTVRARWPGR